MNLSVEEQKQYSRHILLNEVGIEGQEKLNKAKVLVIGAGGLSCPVLQYLTAAGVGVIGIIDDDIVDQSNLQRQILFTYDDIGKSKAECAASRLENLNPYISFNIYKEKLTKSNSIELFEQYDIIIDGTDNFPTRYLINDTAVLTKKPIVFGSIYKFEGQVSVMNYEGGATYRCLYPTPPKAGSVPNCSDIGVIGVLPGIIGCLQANEVIKIICGLGNVLSGQLLTFNALSMQQMILTYQKNTTIRISVLEDDYDFLCGIVPVENEVSALVLKEKFKDYNLLDVRTYLEREHFNIGGMHIPLDELSIRISEIPVDKKLVVYCKMGIRSLAAIDILRNADYPSGLLNLKNGIQDF